MSTNIEQFVNKFTIEAKPKINEELLDHDKLVESQMKNRRCMFRNGHGWQEKWDIFVMLLAVYNSFTIPLQVMFHPHSMDHPVYILVDLIINIVFICDMLVNLQNDLHRRRKWRRSHRPQRDCSQLPQVKIQNWLDRSAAVGRHCKVLNCMR